MTWQLQSDQVTLPSLVQSRDSNLVVYWNESQYTTKFETQLGSVFGFNPSTLPSRDSNLVVYLVSSQYTTKFGSQLGNVHGLDPSTLPSRDLNLVVYQNQF